MDRVQDNLWGQSGVQIQCPGPPDLGPLKTKFKILNPSHFSGIQIWILNPTLNEKWILNTHSEIWIPYMYTGMAHMKFESRILACLQFESWISGPFSGLNPESLTPSSRALDFPLKIRFINLNANSHWDLRISFSTMGRVQSCYIFHSLHIW